VKKIKVKVTTGYVGCEISEIIEVDKNIGDKELEKLAFDAVKDMIEWEFYEVEEEED
jgi:hypothetical protein